MSSTKKTKKYIWSAGIAVVLLVVLMIPMPYYLYQPGDVEPLSPVITVENGHKSEQGNFYLTTVSTIKTSHLYYLIYGWFAPNTQIRKEQSVSGNLSEDEYDFLLRHMMTSSQQNAVIAGLRAAGEVVPVQNKGVFVTNVLPVSKAKGKISVGDIITEIDGKKMQKSADVIAYLSAKKAGETVNMVYLHEGKRQEQSFELTVINDQGKVGLGIQPEDEFDIHPPRQVKINTRDIGGPSAGLMFSLEILNQVLPEDLTKGYQIAGTGTIDQEGNVGQIGGIRDKIVAAHEGKVDIFFCPADVQPGDTNAKDIEDEAKKRNYSIRIVPVRSVQEALHYLKQLQPK
ncbi:SepM family pheromone-processing serine protease [Paenibacillus dokdonensis]|uniref:endopeptidase La n=1 Tax=Paenibacillus dokdonensis TaxID=2567944 RepID=A0ABU6GUR0_9BACL|nr:SepM family pheromone-processing serine protease [Paenibacillus dokdonensis]MEC0243484.1 SepM family pheromone-processing serine protease [Paenibacillus dokdonensis]